MRDTIEEDDAGCGFNVGSVNHRVDGAPRRVEEIVMLGSVL